jgi:hypothetical protein
MGLEEGKSLLNAVILRDQIQSVEETRGDPLWMGLIEILKSSCKSMAPNHVMKLPAACDQGER